MKPHFYSHIVEIDTVVTELGTLNLDESEHRELVILVESSVHHVVLDTVLSELSEDDKKTFLHHVHEKRHDDLWTMLKDKTHGIEEKIRDAAESVKAKFRSDIEEAKREG